MLEWWETNPPKNSFFILVFNPYDFQLDFSIVHDFFQPLNRHSFLCEEASCDADDSEEDYKGKPTETVDWTLGVDTVD